MARLEAVLWLSLVALPLQPVPGTGRRNVKFSPSRHISPVLVHVYVPYGRALQLPLRGRWALPGAGAKTNPATGALNP